MHRKEHQRYLRLGQEDKSALASHGWTMGHTILFNETKKPVSVFLLGNMGAQRIT